MLWYYVANQKEMLDKIIFQYLQSPAYGKAKL